MEATEGQRRLYEPKRPFVAAVGVLSVWVCVLSFPMLGGMWLANPHSDQYTAGLPFRSWGARWWKELGEVPLWNPELFGGLPFLAGHHGDVFHPLSFLRLVLSTPVVTNLGFVIHYALAGVFTYILLRRFKTSWTGAVVGGVSYQLTGILASLAQPGHDAKLIVSAMLPLAMIGLVLGQRDGKPVGFGFTALAVGLSLLTAHYQLTYYLLIASGLFSLYLSVGEADGRSWLQRLTPLGFASIAVVVGFGLAAAQMLPFFSYLPYSPRADTYYGYAGATSFGIPWEHVGEFFIKGFVGDAESYWGSNPIKLHSEYLGLPVIALAGMGLSNGRRRLKMWLGGIGVLFLLISLGGATPFYRLWWAMMPYVKQTRAPGMAFFVVALIVSMFAALGAERLEREGHRRVVTVWLVVAGLMFLLAITGVFGTLAESLASLKEPSVGRRLTIVAQSDRATIMYGAVGGGAVLALLAGLTWAIQRGKIAAPVFAVAVPILVGGDLWLNARGFWTYTNDHHEVFRLDPITEYVSGVPLPHRTLDFGVYPGSALMGLDIPQVLGYHGNEMHRYDELVGGKNTWQYVGNPRIWEHLAVRFLIVPGNGPDSVPGFAKVMAASRASTGQPASLYERIAPARYARVVPAGITIDSTRLIPTLLDPRFDLNRIVLFDPEQQVALPPVTAMPELSSTSAVVTAWQPGRMTIQLDPAPLDSAFVVVAENWFVDWKAAVDGSPSRVLRGNNTFITVPVPPGAQSIQLHVESNAYKQGRVVSIVSLVLALGMLVMPWRSVIAHHD